MSISSTLISGVATWRNPLGDEKNWLRDLNRDKRMPASIKITMAGWAFTGIMIIAIVESIGYFTFKILVLPLTSIGIHHPRKFFAGKLESSKFAIWWALALFTSCNWECSNLCTTEYFARRCYQATLRASDELQGKKREPQENRGYIRLSPLDLERYKT